MSNFRLIEEINPRPNRDYQSYPFPQGLCLEIDEGFVCIEPLGHASRHYGKTLATGHEWMSSIEQKESSG